ncbi:MAG: hypothetical protein SHS37scaffold220_24 [Phage 67_12]|nr:MAG: hypothetical protein SHS37scaffold220_24 [Phage 67_12]
MNTIGSIRRANLERLVMRAGTLEALAQSADTTSIYLSQIRNQAVDAKSGRPREMGTAMARRLERASGKPDGWMDVDHSSEPDEKFSPFAKFSPLIDTQDDRVKASGRALAHDLSQARPTVEPTTIDWGDLMKPLPRAFTLVARDDALAPLLSKGHKARFSTERVAERTDLPGRKVLVADRDDNCFIREYRLKRGQHWQAVATNDAAGFEPLDSIADGLRVLAVMTGVDWE